jgi:hypothetical protein
MHQSSDPPQHDQQTPAQAPHMATEWAAKKITWVTRWAIRYWVVYTWFAPVSRVVAILVPVASAIMLYVPEPKRAFWKIVVLVVGGVGLILQVLASLLRLKERSLRGRRMANKLEGALVAYQTGLTQAADLVIAIQGFLDEDYQEEGP